jgi:hypothetical protein
MAGDLQDTEDGGVYAGWYASGTDGMRRKRFNTRLSKVKYQRIVLIHALLHAEHTSHVMDFDTLLKRVMMVGSWGFKKQERQCNIDIKGKNGWKA